MRVMVIMVWILIFQMVRIHFKNKKQVAEFQMVSTIILLCTKSLYNAE